MKLNRIAFFKGPGDWIDRIIRWKTGSLYSHVDIILDDLKLGSELETLCFASSGRRGNGPTGARMRYKSFTDDSYEIVSVPVSVAQVIRLYTFVALLCRHQVRFNWLDLVARLFGKTYPSANTLTCVEAALSALKVAGVLPDDAGCGTPQELYDALVASAETEIVAA